MCCASLQNEEDMNRESRRKNREVGQLLHGAAAAATLQV